MNIGVSCIGFESMVDSITTCKKYGIKNLELVFNKVNDWNENSYIEKTKGLNIKSSQSLFYGVDCDSFSSDTFIEHFKTLINLSKKFDIKTLVLGSPKLRKKEDKTKLNDIFKNLDNLLENTGIIVCIEPNARIYGGEYFFTIKEINEFLKNNSFKNIFTMIDTHNSWEENMNPLDEYNEYKDIIKHIHISNYNLSNIEDFTIFKNFLDNIKDYEGIITFEVLKINDKTLNSIKDYD
jgi:sugar phosphate isomerase/epimerase